MSDKTWPDQTLEMAYQNALKVQIAQNELLRQKICGSIRENYVSILAMSAWLLTGDFFIIHHLTAFPLYLLIQIVTLGCEAVCIFSLFKNRITLRQVEKTRRLLEKSLDEAYQMPPMRL